MKDVVNDIMKFMETIEYGFKDNKGNNIIFDEEKWDKEFSKFYYLLSPKELIEKKCGVCWDQVELERKLFKEAKILAKTYFIYTNYNENLPSHTFLVYNYNNKYYWFEHSWKMYKGIHEYDSLKHLLKDVKKKFIASNKYIKYSDFTFIYEYDMPKYNISCEEMYKYIETQRLIKINKPLYFYHLINKNSNVSKGIYSLQYMYDNKLNELFDKYVSKYEKRITSDWNITKYKGKSELTREEYIDALNKFRGKFGSRYIYFFRFAPYKELGNKMETILNCKDLYRINVNDEEVMINIKDIFYGYDMSSSDNAKLNKKYYEKVTKEEYFKNYNDAMQINFATLNHIGIAFNNDICPIEFLEKVKIKKKCYN